MSNFLGAATLRELESRLAESNARWVRAFQESTEGRMSLEDYRVISDENASIRAAVGDATAHIYVRTSLGLPLEIQP